LKGKVIWVTGASSGIGEFLAMELAKNGAKLALSGRSAANLDITRDNCIGNH
jgi:dehydrogenase/reductase SDR family protein 7